MTTKEALEVCDKWFAYLDRTRARSVEIQRLATDVRKGLVGAEEAKRQLKQLDMSSVTVFDGGYLEPAVKHLYKLARKEKT